MRSDSAALSSPMFPSKPRRITRSRNGCAVCKCKRLKCDEARPNCSRCERLGIACPGYQKPLKWAAVRRTPEETSNLPRRRASRTLSESASYSFEQPSTSSNNDVCSSELLGEFTSPFDAGVIPIPEQCVSALDFSFEELSGFTESQFEQIPGTTPGVTYSDELWRNAAISTEKSVSHVPTSASYPRQLPELQDELPLARSLQDCTSILVEYYFKEVCGMMSCYDSPMNPYRTTISNIWSRSQSLYYITQSMAAACLSEVSPSLASIGRQLQDQAALCLSLEARGPHIETSSLLALVMLGMSRSWHDPESVGQPEFDILAKLVSSSESFQTNPNLVDRQRTFFFYNSLVYWQMLLAFVTDREPNLPGIMYSHPQLVLPDGLELPEPRMPHPQTGIGIEVQILVAKVGNLVRRERKRIRNRQFVSQGDIDQAKVAILDAERLHSELCTIQLPGENAIVDSGDEMTPPDHLLKVAEAYRCTGLLQLYRNFPDLLSAHVSLDVLTNQFINSSTPAATSHRTSSGFSQDAYLTCLALHILDLVHDIPVSSRSRSIQPLLFVSICSELALGRGDCSFATLHKAPVASIASSPRFKDPLTDLEILRARRFVISRLSSFQNILAAKPISRMLLLVKETWRCMEEGQKIFWIDVMMEKGYETLMG